MTESEDFIQKSISEFSSRVSDSDISAAVAKEVKYRLLDSIAVSAASLSTDAIRILRSGYIGEYPLIDGSTIWFSDFKTVPESAAFVNGSMVRALDFNDTYLSLEPLHPSDMIASLYAASEYLSLDTTDLIRGVAVGYEVGIRLCDSASLRVNGWDHVNYTMLGAVAGLGNLMGLSQEEIAEALAIAAVPHISLRQTRSGRIRMWKASAASEACRHALFSIFLAMKGYQGPDKPFTGEMGFVKQLGLKLDPKPIESLKDASNPESILKSYMKFHPVEYHAQSAVDAALLLKERYGFSYRDISRVVVDTTQASYDIIVKHPEKWRPENRETADHSLPYIVAYTLVYGEIWLDAYSRDKLADPRIREVMDNMEVRVDPELDGRYPEEVPNRVKVYLKDGSIYEETVFRPRGYPGSGYEVEKLLIDKVRRLLNPYYPEESIEEIISICLYLEKYDLPELSEALVI